MPIGEPCIYDPPDPDCTGWHSSGHPKAEVCPSALAAMRARDRKSWHATQTDERRAKRRAKDVATYAADKAAGVCGVNGCSAEGNAAGGYCLPHKIKRGIAAGRRYVPSALRPENIESERETEATPNVVVNRRPSY